MVVARLITLLTLFCSSGVGAAPKSPYIQMELEAISVNLNRSVILNVVSTGLEQEISLASLDALPFQRRETLGGHLRIMDGEWIELATRRIELIPQQVGTFTLGPLTAGSISSNTLELQVLAAPSDDWEISETDVQFESTISSLSPYTQQLIVFEASLKHRHNLISPDFVIPAFKQFRVIKETEDKRIWHDDGWRTVHWRYLLFPETSGKLEIPPWIARGKISRLTGGSASFERQTKRHSIEVKAPPIQSGWWLPARNLEISEEWSESPPELALGNVLKRRIRVTAENVSASQLPRLTMKKPEGLNVRTVDVKRGEGITDGVLKSYLHIDFEILPNSSDAVYFDEIELPWWDTVSNTPQTAFIPPQRLEPAAAQREDLLAALDESEMTTDRIAGLYNHWLPADSFLMLLPILLASLVYFIKQLQANFISTRRSKIAIQKPLIAALKNHRLEPATRWINAKAGIVGLTQEGHNLKKSLNTALEAGSPISDSRWQEWLDTAIHTALLESEEDGVRQTQLPSL